MHYLKVPYVKGNEFEREFGYLLFKSHNLYLIVFHILSFRTILVALRLSN